MTENTIFALIGLFINLIVLAVGVTWIIGQIKSTTIVLNVTISNLRSSIDKLDEILTAAIRIQSENTQKIIRLEERIMAVDRNKHEEERCRKSPNSG